MAAQAKDPKATARKRGRPWRLAMTYATEAFLEQLPPLSIEECINSIIRQNISLETNIKSFKEAQQDGAISLFGEKYGDVVRSIKFGESHELCGGTHVKNTSEIRSFIIKSESAISTGIRRIEAISGDKAVDYLMKQAKTLKEIKNFQN